MVNETGHSHFGHFMRDYGMVFVLLLIGVLFSVMTIDEQHPTDARGGRQVADKVIASYGKEARVLIVARNTAGDRLFTEAAAARLKENGGTVVAVVNGDAIDARKTIDKQVKAGGSIDAIATINATSKWPIWNNIESIKQDTVTTPDSYYWPVFLKQTNLLSVANQTAIYAIIAIGMTMVIITAGIDLCVGSLVALASVVSALVIRDWGSGTETGTGMMLLGLVMGVGICGLAGGINGLMVTAFRVPPFIVTLGMMMMASGLAFRLTEGRSIAELPESFFWIGGGKTAGIPNPVILMIVLYVIAHIVMTRMSFGRFVYAIGGNEEAARLSGVPVKRVLLAVYIICGALAGLGGIVLASQLAAGDPKFGVMYELEVIAAVVVGGTSLLGGSGKIFGTLIGAFIIAVIKNGMNLTDVHPFNQKIVLGAVLLAAVLIDTLKRRGMSH